MAKAKAKTTTNIHINKKPKKRPGVHSKNASPNQNGFKTVYRGQGK